MSVIQRPTKQGNATTYQGKVAAGYKKILAAEMDADLDLIYSAWNQGVDTTNIKDGSITGAKLAAGAIGSRELADGGVGTVDLADNSVTAAKLDPATVGVWVPGAGNTLTPQDATKTVRIAGTTSTIGEQAQLLLGTRTIKARIEAISTLDWLGLTLNSYFDGTTWHFDDPTTPWWILTFATVSDEFVIARGAAGAPAAPGLLKVDNVGQLTTGSSLKITGPAAGIRCQNVGSLLSDGYSPSLGIGFNANTGYVGVRVDTNQIGTMNITPLSDERVKTAVAADVPGLDAVLALRPISFEYDHTQRPVGFEQGRHYGLIAQEAQPLVPLAVLDDGSDEHWLSIDYRHLVPVLIRAVQELAAKVTGA